MEWSTLSASDFARNVLRPPAACFRRPLFWQSPLVACLVRGADREDIRGLRNAERPRIGEDVLHDEEPSPPFDGHRGTLKPTVKLLIVCTNTIHVTSFRLFIEMARTAADVLHPEKPSPKLDRHGGTLKLPSYNLYSGQRFYHNFHRAMHACYLLHFKHFTKFILLYQAQCVRFHTVIVRVCMPGIIQILRVVHILHLIHFIHVIHLIKSK